MEQIEELGGDPEQVESRRMPTGYASTEGERDAYASRGAA